MDNRGIDADPGWVNRKLREIERAIEALRSERRGGATTISDGDLTIEGGGSAIVRDGGDVSINGGGDLLVNGGGGASINDGGDLSVNGGGSASINDGGNLDIYGTGKVQVWGNLRKGTMEDGRFGVTTMTSGGSPTYPSTLAQPDGFLCDAGPGLGYAVFRVDEATGAAVVTSTVDQVLLPYTNTSDAANTHILLNGQIQMVTSSLRYKQDVEVADVDPTAVLSLTGKTWRDKALVEADPDTERRNVGFIAEDLDAAGLGMFVDYDAEGRPDAIQYDRLSVALLAVVKSQQTQIDDLTARVDALTDTPTT